MSEDFPGTTRAIDSQSDIEGWQQVANEMHTWHPALQELAKSHLETRVIAVPTSSQEKYTTLEAIQERITSLVAPLSRDPKELADEYSISLELAEGILTQAEMRLPAERVAVRVPTGALATIVEDGRLRSVLETGKSEGGGPGKEYQQQRIRWEHNQLGQEPGEEPIIYGFLEDSDTLSDAINLGRYGDVEFVLKPEVAQRSTFTMGDSIVNGRKGASFRTFEDAVLLKQIRDTKDQFGKSGFQSEIEAQIFGGVSLDNIESATVLLQGSSLDNYLPTIDRLHSVYPDLRLTVLLDSTKKMNVSYQSIVNHPYIDFIPVVDAPRVSVSDKAEGVPESALPVIRQQYIEAKARKEKVQAGWDNWLAENYPGQAPASNLKAAKLIYRTG